MHPNTDVLVPSDLHLGRASPKLRPHTPPPVTGRDVCIALVCVTMTRHDVCPGVRRGSYPALHPASRWWGRGRLCLSGGLDPNEPPTPRAAQTADRRRITVQATRG